MSQGAISALEKRDSSSSEHAPALAKALGISLHELLTGEKYPTGMIEESARDRDKDDALEAQESAINIPLLANSGSMGGGSALLDEDVVIGALSVKLDWVAKYLPGISSPGKLRFIHAYGESMAPTFSGGDILLVDTGITVPDTDGVYVLEVGNELYIKRVSRRFNGQHEVTSDNPLVKTVDTLNGDHSVQVKGLVVWAWNGRKL